MDLPIAGEATFSGCVCRITVRRDESPTILPPPLRPAYNSSDRYSCLLVFGEQSAGVTWFGGVPFPWPIRYRELMVATPCAGGASGREELFIAGMICDYWPATWNGNVYYGFNKRFASMTATATAFHAAGDGNTRGFHATVGGNGRSNDAASLDWIRHVVKLPVLGRRDDGSWVRSSFDWRFDAAIVEPVTVDIDVTAPFAELPGGRYSDADGTAAACRVRGMRWCLSWPAPAMK